jgi:preprotein translocase subunit YajC
MHALVLTTVPLAQAGGGIASFIPLLLIVAVFYLLLIRPQQRKAKQHQELVSSIGVGDQVVTIGGIHGTVQTMDDDTVRIEVAPTVVITMARGAIARRVTEDDEPDDDTTSDELTVETDPTDTP